MAVEKGALPVFATRQMRIVRSVATEINIALLKMPLRFDEGWATGKKHIPILLQ